MKLIDAFCSLPTSVSSSVLCEWLVLRDVVHADSACCAWQRNMLLDLFQAQEFTLKILMLDDMGTLRWICRRNIKVHEINVSTDIVDNSTASKYLQKLGKHVRVVDTDGSCSVHDVYLFVAHCRNLHTLTVGNTESMVAVRELLRCNPHVQKLTILSFSEDHRALFCYDTFSQIKTLCVEGCKEARFPWHTFAGPALESLTLKKLRWFADLDILLLAAHQVTKLRQLRIVGINLDDRQIGVLVKSCLLVTHLDITNNDVVTDAGILTVVQTSPLLERLELGGCGQLTELTFTHIKDNCANRLTGLAVDLVGSSELAVFVCMMQECKKLVCVDVSVESMPTLSVAELEQVIVAMSHIRYLSLGDELAKDVALCLVGKHCARLERLHLCDRRLHLSAAPLALAQGCPNLTLIVMDDLKCIGSRALPFWKFMRPQLRFALTEDIDQDDLMEIN